MFLQSLHRSSSFFALRHSLSPLNNPIHSGAVYINSSFKFISLLSEMYHLITHGGTAEHLLRFIHQKLNFVPQRIETEWSNETLKKPVKFDYDLLNEKNPLGKSRGTWCCRILEPAPMAMKIRRLNSCMCQEKVTNVFLSYSREDML